MVAAVVRSSVGEMVLGRGRVGEPVAAVSAQPVLVLLLLVLVLVLLALLRRLL